MKQLHTCTADPSCVDNSQGRSRLVHASPPSHGCQRDLSRGFDASRSLGAPPRAWRHARYAEGAGWGSWGHTGPKGRREPAEAWKEGSMATGVPQRAHPPGGHGAMGRAPGEGAMGRARRARRRAARAPRRRASAAPRAAAPPPRHAPPQAERCHASLVPPTIVVPTPLSMAPLGLGRPAPCRKQHGRS